MSDPETPQPDAPETPPSSPNPEVVIDTVTIGETQTQPDEQSPDDRPDKAKEHDRY